LGQLQREVFINAPPAAVFAFLAEPERLPTWTPGVLSVRRTSPGPVGVGATTETQVEAFGVRQTLLGRCIAFEAPRRLVVENVTASGIKIGSVTVGTIKTTSTSELVPEGSGTRVVARMEYALGSGFMASIAEGIAGPKMQADFDTSLHNLKRLLEQA
jgi:carbon monoxide dehydrogenase subunit G